MKKMGCRFLVFWAGMLVLVLGKAPESDKVDTKKFKEAEDEVTPEKWEATVRKLMDNLNRKSHSDEEELRTDDMHGMGDKGKKSKTKKRSYEEEFSEMCGSDPLQRCPVREFNPPEGHVCENIDLLEPNGPFCNCPSCTGEEMPRDIRETDFEEREEILAENARMKGSVYKDKWKAHKRYSNPDQGKLKKEQFRASEGGDTTSANSEEEIPNRNLFCCKKTQSIYEAGKAPSSSDPQFQDQMKSITEEEQHPSLGILKYHQKRSLEEGEL